jgi:hypothetical protein
MTINEVRELKVGDTVVFNGGHSAIVMEIQAFGNGRIEYVLKDALEKAFHYNDVDISRCACGSYRCEPKFLLLDNGRVNKQKLIKNVVEPSPMIGGHPGGVITYSTGTDYTDYCKYNVMRTKEMYKQMLNARYGIGTASLLPDIDDVIFSGPATVVKWKDGTKTVVKCNKGENFDPEKGLVIAITKKALGNKGNYYETIRKWMHPGVTVLKTITVKSNGVETEINKVSSDDIIKIINTGKPDGNFYCYSKKEKKYIAVDNTTGEAFTESFKDKKSCLDWLANKEKTV